MAEPIPASNVAAEITANPEWRAAVLKADARVRKMLDRWAATKSLAWKVVDAGDRPRFELEMTEEDRSVSCRFDLAELGHERTLSQRSRDAWGRLTDQGIRSTIDGIKRLGEELLLEGAGAAQN